MKFSKRVGLTESHFLEGLLGKTEVTFFKEGGGRGGGGLQFLHKKMN